MPLFGLSESDVRKMEAKRDVKGLIKALEYKKPVFSWGPEGEILIDKAVKPSGWHQKELESALVRSSVAEALGRIGDDQAVDALIAALSECFRIVRSPAVEALGKIGGEHAVDGLIAVLNDTDGYARSVPYAMAKSGRIPLAHVKDWYSIVRSAAAEALGEIGNTRSVSALTAALKDPEVKVHESATEALKELEKKIRSGSFQPYSIPIIDLRSEEEQTVASRARSTLEMEDEEIAKKLVQLSKLSDIQYAIDKMAYEKTVAEFRRIGEQLCANGGDERMKRIAYRVQALGGRSQDCEMYWAGICGWLA